MAFDISPIIVEVLVSQTQPEPSTSPQEEILLDSEEMSDFGEDVVVSLGKYFWSKKEKAIIKKGTKRTREGTLKHLLALNQFLWRNYAPNVRQGALDTTTAIGDLARANYDSVSHLHKDLLDKE